MSEDACTNCGAASDPKLRELCRDCLMADYDESDTDCANCGGEGFTYGCSWEWQCDTWDGDSCLCTRRCEWCNPPKLTPEQQQQREAMRQLIASAWKGDPA